MLFGELLAIRDVGVHMARLLVDPLLAAMLIRPDGYIAWAADDFEAADEERLSATLQRWFGPPQLDRSYGVEGGVFGV